MLMFKTSDLDKFDNPVWKLIVQEAEVRPGTFHKPDGDAPQPTAPAKPAPGSQGEPARRQPRIPEGLGVAEFAPGPLGSLPFARA